MWCYFFEDLLLHVEVKLIGICITKLGRLTCTSGLSGRRVLTQIAVPFLPSILQFKLRRLTDTSVVFGGGLCLGFFETSFVLEHFSRRLYVA